MNNKTKRLTRLALFAAMIIVLAFTPLGYLKTAGLEITFITIPVVIGAVAMGPAAGGILGALFGLTSFIQCFGMSPFGAALLSVNPVSCFFVCLLPRALMGWLTGLIFDAADRRKPESLLAYGAAGLAGPLLNTLFFMTALMLFFGSAEVIVNLRGGMALFPFLVAFVGLNGLIEALACFVISTAICKSLSKYLRNAR